MFAVSPLTIGRRGVQRRTDSLEDAQVVPIAPIIRQRAQGAIPGIHISAAINGIAASEARDDVGHTLVQRRALCDMQDAGKISRAVGLINSAEFQMVVVGGAAPVPLILAAAIYARPRILARNGLRRISQKAAFDGAVSVAHPRPVRRPAGNLIVGAD